MQTTSGDRVAFTRAGIWLTAERGAFISVFLRATPTLTVTSGDAEQTME